MKDDKYIDALTELKLSMSRHPDLKTQEEILGEYAYRVFLAALGIENVDTFELLLQTSYNPNLPKW